MTGSQVIPAVEMAAQIENLEGSAWEAFMPHYSEDQDASNFLRQCFTMQVSHVTPGRPSLQLI